MYWGVYETLEIAVLQDSHIKTIFFSEILVLGTEITTQGAETTESRAAPAPLAFARWISSDRPRNARPRSATVRRAN
jgi:hypothetical protein